ncbi:sensor histidine kinase [Pigmentiphaga litoralis]|nr:HAMP domain-containing sensor histidine kinase [Pigmentiphaga litoralis]
MRLSLSQRLSVAFAVLLLISCSVSAVLQMRANTQHEQETVQRLSAGLAGHIASNSELMDRSGWKPQAVRDLFNKLMAVNPSVEVYLLDRDGQVVASGAPRRLRRDQVDLAPIRQLLAGHALPLFGDDPRSPSGRKVFSAAPLKVGDEDMGYVYVVLLGQAHDMLAADVAASSVLRTTLWSLAVAGFGILFAGLIAFRLITRPLRSLTDTVRHFDTDGAALAALAPPGAVADVDKEKDDIVILRQAFAQMAQRLAEQWRQLTRQDQQRREMVANISHDLRTPLTSLHGYLETLAVKGDSLDATERRRYLDIALGQSRKVGRLAQELFELARLESGTVQPEPETFSLPELVQDVLQKCELAAEARDQHLVADFAQDLPPVHADLGMIERVLTNLLDNAIRHSPAGGRIEVVLRKGTAGVDVEVSDTGPGIPAAARDSLFLRPSSLGGSARRDGGGLGLVIVHRILQLHHSDIRLIDVPAKGAVFHFSLSPSTA